MTPTDPEQAAERVRILLDAFAAPTSEFAAVRRDTLAKVRAVVNLESTYRDGMNDVTWIARDPLLAALDALEG